MTLVIEISDATRQQRLDISNNFLVEKLLENFDEFSIELNILKQKILSSKFLANNKLLMNSIYQNIQILIKKIIFSFYKTHISLKIYLAFSLLKKSYPATNKTSK